MPAGDEGVGAGENSFRRPESLREVCGWAERAERWADQGAKEVSGVERSGLRRWSGGC